MYSYIYAYFVWNKIEGSNPGSFHLVRSHLAQCHLCWGSWTGKEGGRTPGSHQPAAGPADQPTSRLVEQESLVGGDLNIISTWVLGMIILIWGNSHIVNGGTWLDYFLHSVGNVIIQRDWNQQLATLERDETSWVYDIYMANEILVLKKIERISVSTRFHLFHTVVPSSLLLAVWGLGDCYLHKTVQWFWVLLPICCPLS